MFKRCSHILLLAGGLLLVASAAAAGNRPFAFTLTPQVGIMVFEGNQDLDTGYAGGLALGYNFSEHWGAEGVFTLTDSALESGSAEVDVYAAHLDLLYHFRPQKRLVPYVSLAAGGLVLESNGGNDGDLLAGYGVGLKYFLPEGVALRLDLKHLVDINYSDSPKEHDYYNMFAATAGITFQLGGEKMALLVNDTDGDGIVDAYDRCPGSKPRVTVDGSGCALDADGDGVDDRKDLCLETPAGTRVDASGCPEPVVPADTDGDGVADDHDRCPETPAGSPVDAAGCPSGVQDADGDGVGDDLDRCPNTPTYVPVNAYGCPSDSDGDGVFDADDQCPGSAPGVEVGPDGCETLAGGMAATPVTEIVGSAMIIRLELPPGEYKVQPENEAALARAAAFISQQPGVRFNIDGHTDSVGPSEFNLELSKKRAESVRAYLAQRFGVEADRLIVRGLGEGDPIGDNSTQEGRFRNRRVVISPADAP
ncbi:MAG: hypothetical protein A2091_11035 [Desulfuromonadales bacterium GWD2_61_12]|nr:MAG: hypothetical protein A2005_10605 [Desulfuromonadales bacterium GWC2_61_20]OGR35194.1 MAG: hypothetical protein A2091_11035 [Desulfuromonadales bacterium GWD2_61_12]HAD04071.1 outer membrane beta-barrel domain-containing protein [Desulfuromonas sp.]HBT83547.1 outer membrane beta-barrel domain-containing protein [Desulfuromonas sp.]